MKNVVRFLLIFTLGLSPSALVLAQTTTSPATSSEITIEQLQQQIQSLLAQIEELKSQVETVKTELKFTKALKRGMTGQEVKELQEFLKTLPDIYPEGLVTGYFGPLTEAAVKKLQEKQGIEQVGNVGPKTLNKLNELITEGAGASGVVPPGLLTAPGIQKKTESPAAATLPATSAIPAVPAQPTATATPAIPATSATPATPATQTTTTSTTSSTATTNSLIKIIASQLPQKPWDVAVSGSDYIVAVTDLDKNTGRLLRITADGKVTTIASLNRRLAGVAVSGSNYYVLDGDTNVLKISPDGTVSTILTLVTSGIGTGAFFQNDIAVSNSDLIITDYAGGRLLRVASTTNAVSAITSGLRYVTSVIVDGSDFVVLYGGAQYLSRVTPKGQITQIASLADKVSGHTSVTKIGSDFYVNSGFGNTIARVSANGTVTLLPIPNENYDFISLANNGSEIIATDYDNYRLLRINPSAPAVAVPSGTVPAVPATPATPATPVTSAAPTTSAAPATPATSAAPTTSTTQTTTTTTTSTGTTITTTSTTTSTTATTTTTTPSSLTVSNISPTSGANGTVITLTGTGFYNASAPSYLDSLCFLYTPTACANAYTTPTSNTQIQFTVPSNTYLPAGKAYNLILQTYTNSSNLTQTFTVTAATTTTTTTSDTTPPSAPAGFSAHATSSSQINLSWTASTDNVGVTGYKVYRNGTFLTNATLNFYWDTGLTASTNYSYTVAAYDAAGNLSSQSNSASVATQSGTGTCPGLNLTFQDNKTSYITGYWIEYTWTCTPSGSASYVEVQVVKSDGTATAVHSSSGNTKTLEFQSSTFGPGNYTLRACFTAGCSSVITSLPFTITAASLSPAAPSNFIATVLPGTLSGVNINLTWTDNADNESGFYLQGTNPSGGQNNAYLAVNQKSYNGYTNVSPGVYSFTIKTYISDNGSYTGNKTFSSPVSISVTATICAESWTCGNWSSCSNSSQTRTCTDANSCGTTNSKPALSQSCTVSSSDAVPPSTPTNLSSSASLYTNWCDSQITIHWMPATDNVGVTGYKIYRSGPGGTAAFDYNSSTYLTFNSYSMDLQRLLAGTTYSYTVAAYDAAGNISDQSSPLSITTCVKPVMTYPNGGEVFTTGSSINLKWQSPTPANSVTSYKSSFYLVSVSDPDYKVLETKLNIDSNAGENTTPWTVTTYGFRLAPSSGSYYGYNDLGPGQYYIRVCPAGHSTLWVVGQTTTNCDDSDTPITISTSSTSQLERRSPFLATLNSIGGVLKRIWGLVK